MAMSLAVVKQDFAKLLQKALSKAGVKGMVALAAGSAYVFSKLLKAWKLRKAPPGSMGLPVLGETLSFVMDPRKFAETRTKKYGNVFTTHILFTPAAYISGPLTKEIFKSSTIGWPSTWNELLGEHSLSTNSGGVHKKQRSIISKAFSNEALASYVPALQEITQKHLKQWADRSAKTETRYTPDTDIMKYTFEVAEKVLLGQSTGETEEGLITAFKTWLQGYEGLVPFNVPWTAHGKAMRARAELMVAYKQIITQKRKNITAEQRDMLAQVMNAKDEDGQSMTDEQLQDFCITVMFAGHDTTKASICTMMHLLSSQPKVEKQLTEEIDQMWDGSSPITWEMIDALEHGKCGAFIGEQLRLMPAVPAVYRLLTEDTEIGGYTIPKGWKIMTSPFANHTLLEGVTEKIDLSIDHSKWRESEYMPFGGGSRKCVGYRFARQELIVWLMCFFKHYKLDVDPKETGMKMLPFITTDIKIRVHQRN